MNKQPFYHEVNIIFTSTRPIAQEEFAQALERLPKRKLGIVAGSLEIEEFHEPEPGDPADLM